MKEFRKLSELRQSPDNPRSINTKDFKRLCKQVKKLGQYKPVVITPDGEILGGNMRYLAYKELGIEDVWISVVEPKTKAQKIEYMLSDNDRAGYYNDDQLAELCYGLDLDFKDFSVDCKEPVSLDELMSNYAPDNENDDVVPEVKETDIKLGDLFQLGEHRLLCGDSTKKEDVERLMNGEKANLVSTDPPYCVNYTGDDRPVVGKDWSETYHEINIENPKEFLANAVANAVANAAYYVWHSSSTFDIFSQALKENGVFIHQIIIWSKPKILPGYSVYYNQYEPCIFGWIKGKKPGITEEFKKQNWSNIWNIMFDDNKKASVGKKHPTQKPVEIFERPIMAHTKRDDICYEPFSGSGSQFIAAEKLNRRCYGIEIEPVFCQVIIDRWESYTNKKSIKLE